MNQLNLSVSTESAMVAGVVVPLFRGIVTFLNGQVVDQTNLFDTHTEALAEAGVLLNLYREERMPHETRIGFVSFRGLDELKDDRTGIFNPVCSVAKNPEGQFVVPVYIKVNDVLVTQAVKNQGIPDTEDDGN